MSQQPILRARQPQQSLVPASEHAAELDVELRRANAIASAKNALPASYANNPGAIILADQWARARGIDTLTAVQNVNFISGRPVIDATFQRAMAHRAGYEIRVTEVSDQAATVTVTKAGELLGSVTWTMADAERASLANKDTWRKHPKNMLVARATTDALRWHAPEVLLGVWLEDELESDPVDVLRPMAEPAPPPAEVEVVVTEDIVEAELVEEELDNKVSDGWTVDTLKMALREAGITQAQALMASHKATIAELAKDLAAVARVLGVVEEATAQPQLIEEPF